MCGFVFEVLLKEEYGGRGGKEVTHCIVRKLNEGNGLNVKLLEIRPKIISRFDNQFHVFSLNDNYEIIVIHVIQIAATKSCMNGF